MRIFARGLDIDTAALQRVTQTQDAAELAATTSSILHYVRHTNPGFLTYRFGRQEGKAI
jgi:hypothetical protein